MVEVTEKYIRVRMQSPEKFQEDSMRTFRLKRGKPYINAVIGRPHGVTKTRVQALLFPRDEWSKEDALAWARDHKRSLAFVGRRREAA